MRPDRPGNWWWEDDDGMFHVAEFDKFMEVLEDDCSMTPEKFEDEIPFKRWIGTAHPPKKVKRYNLTREYGSGGPTNNQYMAEGNRYSPGEWVRYEDVKEFLINIEAE
jgi:hypothetical protein